MAPKTELKLAIVAAACLVALRSAVPLLLERSLDSDQAIVGLMAKHLSEFRTFPLFFYGQNYMLGVQAWIAVPFFWLGGPTVAMLRLPLVIVNIAMVAAVILVFARVGVRPLLGLVAALPLILTTPLMSDAMLRTLGAAVEPFAYIVALWMLRGRPMWFGLLFCIAYLHREFAVFAVPALVVAQWREGTLWRPRDVLTAVGGFLAVWVIVDLVKRNVNAYGPPGGEHGAGSLLMQSQQIMMWLSLDAYVERVVDLIVDGIPDMLGARPYAMWEQYGLFSQLPAGSTIAGTALAVALAVALGRVAVSLVSRRDSRREDAFAVYLLLVGVQSILAYGLNGGINTLAMPVVRYALFVLFIPVAVLGAFFVYERRPVMKAAVAALMCVWAAFTASDAVRQIREYAAGPPENPHRQIADYLVEQRIKYGRADYWDAYVVTFLAQERVVLASMGKVRISSYQARVDANASNAVTLIRQPCSVGTPVSAWCVEDPFGRRPARMDAPP